MGLPLIPRRLRASRAALFAVCALLPWACEERLVVIARPADSSSATGSASATDSSSATGSSSATSTTGSAGGADSASGSGGSASGSGGGAPACGTPQPVGAVQACGDCSGSESGNCECKLCDSANNQWQAECNPQGCTCSFNSMHVCSCAFGSPQPTCDALASCCPGWPHP